MGKDPEKERARLKELYASMPLAQLQQIASDPRGVTGMVRSIIEAELRKRGISDAVEENDSDESQLVIVKELCASMPLAQLQQIASDPRAVTGMVRSIIKDELRRRGISDETDKNDSAESRQVVLRRFRDLHEALLAQGSLESAGIPSFLADENAIRMDWLWSNALGGVRLLVSEKDAPEAARVLNQPVPERFDVPGIGEFEQPSCPRCGSLEVTFEELNRPVAYGSVFFGVPVPLHRKGWRCKSCGNTWNEKTER